jgi:hydrogenase expression/formation protein HypD
VKIDGFLCPGHVSTIIGSKPYEFIAKDYRVPCCITGFEPLDILEGIYILIKQIVESESKVEIQYRRVVKEEGNLKAQDLMNRVFETYDSEWRGLGEITKSGLRIKKEFSQFDAEVHLKLRTPDSQPTTEIKGCSCGDILKGKKSPLECPHFAKGCTPQEPLGPCMVSSEGTCAAYYKYAK